VKAVYIDLYSGESITERITSATNAGFNLLILAFWLGAPTNGLPVGPADSALLWQNLGATQQQATINTAHARNVKIIVSAGGATDKPYNAYTGTQYGTAVGNFAKNNKLDGVDFDLELFGQGFSAGTLTGDQAVQWVADASVAARNIIGASSNTINGKLITHAPQSPYFGQTYFTTSTASYTAVYKKVPSVIDYLFVQYYNQGDCYFDCTSLLSNGASCNGPQPGTAVNQIAAAGIPISKIIIGASVESTSPPRSANFFCQCFKANSSYNKGIMIYKYSDFTATYLSSVYNSNC